MDTSYCRFNREMVEVRDCIRCFNLIKASDIFSCRSHYLSCGGSDYKYSYLRETCRGCNQAHKCIANKISAGLSKRGEPFPRSEYTKALGILRKDLHFNDLEEVLLRRELHLVEDGK